MAKHRELAQVVYENATGRASASRIWRTVVVAGAMLGAPLTAAAGEAPPANPPAKTEKAPAQAAGAPVQSKPAPPPPTKAELAKQAKDNVKAIEKEIAELDKAIKKTTADVKAAKDQAARDAANAMLKDQQTKKTELKTKLATAKDEAKKADAEAKAEAAAKKPRPRKPPSDRPIGRGFILS